MTLTHTRSTPRRLAAVSLLAALGALAAALTAGPAYADGTVVPDNPSCEDVIQGSEELKVEPPADGTFDADGFSVTVDVRQLSADDPAHAGDQTGSQVFDFTATGGTVLGVLVKGGPDANFYDYSPAGVTSGTGLHAPVNPNNNKFFGLSHISFCFGPPTTPTTSPPPSNGNGDGSSPPPPDAAQLPKTGDTGFPVEGAATFGLLLLLAGAALIKWRDELLTFYRRRH